MSNMELLILGTKGEIEEESKKHKKQSGILFRHKGKTLLFDVGEKEYLKFIQIYK